MSKSPRMTLTNESVTFTRRGVLIQPILSDYFWWNGSVAELLSIMVANPSLDIDNCIFRVRMDDEQGGYLV
jgi:hypothetical protein